MTKLMLKAQSLLADRKGVTALEYGLIAALVAVAIVGTLTLMGPRLDGTFQRILNALPV